MDKQDLISILYFLEESLGFRVSLHWLRRYLETKDEKDLERLLVSVSRENFVSYETWADLVKDQYLLDTTKGSLEDIKHRLCQEIESCTLLDVLDDPNKFTQAAPYYFGQQSWVVDRLVTAVDRAPNINWKDALSRNQIKSKIWLIDRLAEVGWLTPESKIFLVGGWVGLLTVLMYLGGQRFRSAISVDLDLAVQEPARLLNMNPLPAFRAQQRDVRSMDMSAYKDYVIIDTIVEHFADHSAWVRSLPAGTRVVLQGNDMFGPPDHVNCHADLEAFVADSGLSEIVWSGQIDLPGCNRFMAIGRV